MNTAKKKTTTNADYDKTLFYSHPFTELWTTFDRTREIIAIARSLELAQYKLSLENTRIIHKLIMDNGQTTVNELCKWTLRSRHAVYTLLQRMEKLGLVKKSSPGKSNMITIILTEKGKNLYLQLTSRSIEMIFSALSEDDRQKLLAILNKLSTKARALLGIDYIPPFLSE